MTDQPTDQQPVEIPAGTLAHARADELQHQLNVAMDRLIQLNVEVRIRDAEIVQLKAELAQHTTPTEEN